MPCALISDMTSAPQQQKQMPELRALRGRCQSAASTSNGYNSKKKRKKVIANNKQITMHWTAAFSITHALNGTTTENARMGGSFKNGFTLGMLLDAQTPKKEKKTRQKNKNQYTEPCLFLRIRHLSSFISLFARTPRGWCHPDNGRAA